MLGSRYLKKSIFVSVKVFTGIGGEVITLTCHHDIVPFLTVSGRSQKVCTKSKRLFAHKKMSALQI